MSSCEPPTPSLYFLSGKSVSGNLFSYNLPQILNDSVLLDNCLQLSNGEQAVFIKSHAFLNFAIYFPVFTFKLLCSGHIWLLAASGSVCFICNRLP